MNAKDVIESVKLGAQILSGEHKPANKYQEKQCVLAYQLAHYAVTGGAASVDQAVMELEALKYSAELAIARLKLRRDEGGELVIG